jgi:ATP-dependent Clp protease ATP-binding subunit ClpA
MVAALERGLTTNARVTLMAAHQEAGRTGATNVRADHLLVAILERPDESVRTLLTSVGTDPATVLANLRQRIADRPPVALAVDAVLQMVTADAGKEAHALGDDQIDDVHLLLALLRDPSDPAGATLQAAGLTLDEARRTLRQSRPRRPPETDRVITWSPEPAKRRTSDRGFRRTADGVLTIEGPRRGSSRRATVPSTPLADL